MADFYNMKTSSFGNTLKQELVQHLISENELDEEDREVLDLYFDKISKDAYRFDYFEDSDNCLFTMPHDISDEKFSKLIKKAGATDKNQSEFGYQLIFTNGGDTEGVEDFLTYTLFLESGAVISAVYIAADPDNTSAFDKTPSVEVALDHWSKSETFPSVDDLTLKKTYSSEI